MEEPPITVPNTPNPVPTATVVEPTTLPQVPKKGNSALWLIIIVVLIVAVIAGAYWYMTNQNQTATSEQLIDLGDLDSELETVDETAIDSDFAEIDKDITSL